MIGITKGYLIQNVHGDYLTGRYFWQPHAKPQEGFVHSEGELEKVLTRTRDWTNRPAKLIPARHIPGVGTAVDSEPIRILGLGLTQTLNLVETKRKK